MPATRLASYGTLAVFLIAYTLVVVGAWVVFVAGGLNPVERATGGLVTLVLLVWPQLAPLGRREPFGVVRPHSTAGRGGADYQRKGTA